jgi:hypothetical protein
MNRNRFRNEHSEYDFAMKRMAIALFELGKSIVARPVKPTKDKPGNLHWTKFNKPIDQMTDSERRAAAERLADEMLGIVKDQKK